MNCTLRLVIVGLLVLGMLSACSYQMHQQIPTTTKATVRIVRHAKGETAVPLHPQKVVSLHWYATDAIESLGVKLIGAVKPNSDLKLKQNDFVDIGWPPQIEKVLALKPDLLIGNLGTLEASYSLWAHLQPIILYSYPIVNGHEGWKKPLMLIAEALGKTESAKQVVEQYNSRIADFKQKMGSRLANTKISVVRIDPGQILLMNKSVFCGLILEELGFQRPLSQTLDGDTTINKMLGYSTGYYISTEFITQMDADVLFVVAQSVPTSTNIQKTLEKLKQEPLWLKLRAVQQGKVYVVGRYWLSGSYLSANQVLDDLEKYVLQPN